MEDWKSYWNGRWERGETGWHQDEVEPELVERFTPIEATRVLVPLCGRSLDLAWLASRGHEVVGVELNGMACQGFFEEGKIPYMKSSEGKFTVYRGGGITLLCGDFFDVTPELLPAIGAVYDRAALIALSPELRIRYSAHLKALIRAKADRGRFQFLQIALEKKDETKGPPFSVSSREIAELYGTDFEITPIRREQFDVGEQCVYLFRLKA